MFAVNENFVFVHVINFEGVCVCEYVCVCVSVSMFVCLCVLVCLGGVYVCVFLKAFGRTDGRTDERTNGRTDERTNGRTDGGKSIGPTSEVGGSKNIYIHTH